MRSVPVWVAAVAATVSLPAAQDPPVSPPAPQHENRLAAEASPYLRQHRHNPVDWHAWGPEALARAVREDKPIFLSIGYSACHWCHVMARESFADPAVAEVMNANFVCIKVDREERPDVDEVYMAALQAMGQQGGWPLSAWLLPDGRPFFAGTYFPPQDSQGRPGFRRVLEHLATAWRERRQELETGAAELATHLQQALAPELAPGEPTAALLANVLPQAEQRYDERYGGFAQAPAYAPKFPSPLELQALLRLPDERALAIAVQTLLAMQASGMHDQLGGGFHRYATDRRWLVPHFEKMLYDNALLVPCYLEAAARAGEPSFAATARSTLDWMLRELRAPGGGFWSSQDAQSEGVEGRFFVWSQREFDEVVGDDAPLLRAHFGVTEAGNWEHGNVLSLVEPAAALAARLQRPAAEVERALQRGREALLAARGRRVRPATDDKVLAAWNGLALVALCAGYRHLGDERYRGAAQDAAGFVLRELVVDGRLHRAWHGGTARHAACLEDHAALALGLLALFEIDPEPRWLEAGRQQLQAIATRFRAADGGFWFTADDGELLVARTKIAYDGSTPSGTALAVQAFLRGGLLLGDEALYAHGLGALRANHQLLERAPAAAPALVRALQFHLAEPREVVVAGEPGDPRTQALLQAAWRAFPDHHVVAHVHAGNAAALASLSPVFTGKTPVDGAPAAYVCRRGVCERPVSDPARLLEPR